ncbi:PaaI family thioesterase [Marinivivus vitaminiproducens]|uniref:PaaI family thioesterase n=1 Tax=Marinivivus vitaminiproducens TaxID=3035935 RepID=UPI0027A09A4C|nr:PaaI family thioesterase [Geminicoccaceae bacterium SCSIO 64248]
MTDTPVQADRGAYVRSLGIEVVEWREGFARITMPIQPVFLNRSGVLHGGLIAILLDTVGGYAGTWCSRPGHVRHAVTVSMTTHFTGQSKAGLLSAVGRHRGGGRNIFFSSAEVLGEDGAMLGFGDGVYRYRKGSHDVAGVPVEEGAAGGLS